MKINLQQLEFRKIYLEKYQYYLRFFSSLRVFAEMKPQQMFSADSQIRRPAGLQEYTEKTTAETNC